MFPYLEVGVESISVAIFVVYIFVIFWSDIWLKTKILNHLVATAVKTKCEMQNCFMRVTTWHPMNYTVLHYLQ